MRQMKMLLDKSLDSVFTEIGINPRAWEVFEARVDLSLTLEETGKRLEGISRERVRQIESKANAKILSRMNSISPVFDAIETNLKGKSSAELSRAGETDSQKVRASVPYRIQDILESNDWRADTSDVRKLILLVRTLIFLKAEKNRKSIAERNWPRLTYIVCRLPPAILNHSKVAKLKSVSRRLSRKLSYKEIATQVLEEAGEALHWRTVAERGYQLGRRHSFSTAALYNTLQNHSERFVRVGQGTYALVEWGMSEAEYYPDIISSVLKEETRPLSVDTIHSRVNAIRPVKRQTITMSLDMHPRFYKSIESTYGLRSWLSPREKQTLRTPEWLVEESASFMRVERAIERGYKLQLASAFEVE